MTNRLINSPVYGLTVGPTDILVVGSRGMLAQDLIPCIEQRSFKVVGLDLPDIDITQCESVYSKINSIAPGLVINCAAYTAVDKAEVEPQIAFAINREGARNIAEACARHGIPLIHLSTDYVFDGRATEPYREDAPVNPLSVYGQSKFEGEQVIRTHLGEHLIIRTAWLYGVHGHNFVKTILRLSREREELRIVADQHGCPTWTVDLAKALVEIATQVLKRRERMGWGTYHFCGGGQTTWWEFAQAIVDEGRRRETLRVERVIPIGTHEYPTPAERPVRSVLDCGKIEKDFGIASRPWRDSLRGMISMLYA